MKRQVIRACLLLAAGFEPLLAGPEVIIKARAEQPGEILLVIVKEHNETLPPSGCLESFPLTFSPVSAGTYIAFAGFDVEISTGSMCLSLDLLDVYGNYNQWDKKIAVKDKQFPKTELKVSGVYAKLKESDIKRVEREELLLRELFASRTPEIFFNEGFVAPVPGASSSRFGERRVFNGITKSRHTGVDLRAKQGTLVYASGSGKVVLADELFYLGNAVVIDHGLGLFSYYGHLSEISVEGGDFVSCGEVIGKVGATGRVTGPHLHWAVRLNDIRIDPFSLVVLDFSYFLPVPKGLKPAVRDGFFINPPGKKTSRGYKRQSHAWIVPDVDLHTQDNYGDEDK